MIHCRFYEFETRQIEREKTFGGIERRLNQEMITLKMLLFTMHHRKISSQFFMFLRCIYVDIKQQKRTIKAAFIIVINPKSI